MLYPKKSGFCLHFCSPVDNALGWAQKASSVSGAEAQCIPAVCPVYVCGSGLSRRLGQNLNVEFGAFSFLGTPLTFQQLWSSHTQLSGFHWRFHVRPTPGKHRVQIPTGHQTKNPLKNLDRMMPFLCSECHVPSRTCLILFTLQCLWIIVFWYFVRSSCYLQEGRVIRSYPVTGERKGHGTLEGTFSSLLLPSSSLPSGVLPRMNNTNIASRTL